MQSVLFEDAKQQLDSLCEQACVDQEPYIINRANRNHVVVMSLEDFNAWKDLRPKYQRKDLGQGERSKHYQDYQQGTNRVLLSPNIATAFSADEAVNKVSSN